MGTTIQFEVERPPCARNAAKEFRKTSRNTAKAFR
jgi:hypothetical protein